MTMWAELNVTSHNNKTSATKMTIMRYIIWLRTDVKTNQEISTSTLIWQKYDIISVSLERKWVTGTLNGSFREGHTKIPFFHHYYIGFGSFGRLNLLLGGCVPADVKRRLRPWELGKLGKLGRRAAVFSIAAVQQDKASAKILIPGSSTGRPDNPTHSTHCLTPARPPTGQRHTSEASPAVWW